MGRKILVSTAVVVLSCLSWAASPNIVLITLDTTRADRMGFLGSERGLTPSLDLLAKQSVVFSRAYAQVPLTTPSHAALLTGTYPQFSHLEDLGAPLTNDIPYLPAILHQHGYKTAAFVGAYVLDPVFAAPGFQRGFDFYDAGFRRRGAGQGRYKTVERRAEEVADRALGWISRHPKGPFFVWIHFYDAHDPYDPPSPFKQRFAAEPYDGEIAYTDSVVGSLLAVLQKHGLLQTSVVAVAADHGEAFGEHGEERHGMFLYDETVHVPLLLKLPSNRMAGKRVEERVGLVDVAPTLLETAGIAVPKAMQGQSLFRLARTPKGQSGPAQGKTPDHPVYSETNYGHRAFGWSVLRSWRTGKYLYVEAPKRELYDQNIDPHAKENVADRSKAVADTLDGQLSKFHEATSSAAKEPVRIDPAQAENLRALGYLASDPSGASAKSGADAVDPKDKIGVANNFHRALVDIEEERYGDAIAKLRSVIENEPDVSSTYLELGRALVHERQYAEALPVLREALQRMPDSGMAHYELGLALVKTGQWEAALPEMQAAVERSPKSAELHFYLGAVHARLKHLDDAAAEFETTLQLDPDHYQGNLRYGRMLFFEGNATGALPKLQRAAKMQPDSREAHAFLADAYEALGRHVEAQRERNQAQAESGSD